MEQNKNFDETQIINLDSCANETLDVKEILAQVYSILKEKGHNPVNQITEYILSGDPIYITSYKNARTLISKVERDEILEELVSSYLKDKFE